MRVFAADLAQFLLELQKINAEGGPAAGEHRFYRGGYWQQDPVWVHGDIAVGNLLVK